MLRHHLKKIFGQLQQEKELSIDSDKRDKVANAALKRFEKSSGFGTKKIASKPKSETEMVEKIHPPRSIN